MQREGLKSEDLAAAETQSSLKGKAEVLTCMLNSHIHQLQAFQSNITAQD